MDGNYIVTAGALRLSPAGHAFLKDRSPAIVESMLEMLMSFGTCGNILVMKSDEMLDLIQRSFKTVF